MTAQVDSSSNLGRGSLLRSWVEGARYLGILLGLFAVGFFGHKTHWNFGLVAGAHDDSHPVEKVSSTTEGGPVADDWKVEFPSERSVERSGIKTGPLEQRPIRERVKTTGVITYDERVIAAISARASGTVWRVVKQVGDAVRKGDILVIIDSAEVGNAKAEFLSELVSLESRIEILANLEKIEGAVAARQVREARVAVREATIQLQNAEQKLVNLGLSIRKDDFANLTDLERSAKLQLFGIPEAITADLDRQRMSSNLLAIKASFDGVVIHQDAAPGEMVDAGKPFLDIADLRRMWLKLDVPKEDAGRLTLGQQVRFSPDGMEQELNSTISWISTEVNQQTRTLQVRAEVDNPVVTANAATGQEVRLLRANTFGTGSILLRESEGAFVVPQSSILHADSQPMIFVKTGPLTFSRMDVRLGVRDAKFTQIVSDELQPGLEIVTQGSHVLKSEYILNHVASSGP